LFFNFIKIIQKISILPNKIGLFIFLVKPATADRFMKKFILVYIIFWIFVIYLYFKQHWTMSSRHSRVKNADAFSFNLEEIETIKEFIRGHTSMWQVTDPKFRLINEKTAILHKLADQLDRGIQGQVFSLFESLIYVHLDSWRHYFESFSLHFNTALCSNF